MQGPAQKADAGAARMPPSASTRTEPSILSPSRRQSAARTGIHPLSRSFESLLKGAKSLHIYAMSGTWCSLHAFISQCDSCRLRQRACVPQSILGWKLMTGLFEMALLSWDASQSPRQQ